MSVLSFPLNPTIGQIYSVGNKVWQWNGVAWAVQRAIVAGKSAYEQAIENGFVGTSADWITSLKGEKGDTGNQGPIGLTGLRGEKGDAGDNGIDGNNGINGINGIGVPIGGSQGMVLTKASNDPYDTTWATPETFTDYSVPLGGSQGQFLGKQSAATGDFTWLNLPTTQPSNPELPLGGNQGQVLTKASATSGDVIWSTPDTGAGLPVGGTTGQVLAKSSQFNWDASWITPPATLPEPPTTGLVYGRQNGNWVEIDSGIGTYTDENARDAIGAALVAGSGITIAANDGSDTITITATGNYTDEQAQDAVAAMLTAGSNIILTYDDVANTLTIAATGASTYTDENARDAISAALVAGTGMTVTVDDSGETISLAVDSTSEAERIRDVMASALVAGTNVTITPNDGADTITITASGGSGVPAGGTTGQVLAKLSGTSGDADWRDAGFTSTTTAVTLRGSSITSSSNSSYVITFPSGTVVGDRVIISGGHGFALSSYPSGWAVLDNQTGTNWNGFILTKIMTTADITTGSATIVMAGTFNGVISAVSYIGAPNVKQTIASRNGSGSATRTIYADGAFSSGDTAFIFGSNRNASVNTVDIGNALQVVNAASASGVLKSGAIDPGTTATFSYSVVSGTTGDYQAIVILAFPTRITLVANATVSDLWVGTATDKLLTPKILLDAAISQALVDGNSITIDGNTGFNFHVTLGGNRTLANPTNMKSGQSGVIIVTQDATGGRTLSYGSNWKFAGGASTGGVLSTAANAVDVISYFVRSDNSIIANIGKGYAT